VARLKKEVTQAGKATRTLHTMAMHEGLASLPNRRTTRRNSSDRMAWSTCQADGKWVRKMEPMGFSERVEVGNYGSFMECETKNLDRKRELRERVCVSVQSRVRSAWHVSNSHAPSPSPRRTISTRSNIS
jgi:hypothetical protein